MNGIRRGEGSQLDAISHRGRRSEVGNALSLPDRCSTRRAQCSIGQRVDHLRNHVLRRRIERGDDRIHFGASHRIDFEL
jgi:hypothetical protein